MAELLRGPVTLGNLVFDDPACAAAFGPGEVRGDKLGELARCLAELRLEPNGREDALGDVAVMRYGPGFEVEARVLQQGTRAQLTWIGFASQHVGSPNVPTLDATAFEALRISGERVPQFDEATVRALEAELSPDDGDDVLMMWLKVCLDEQGAIDVIEPYGPPSYVVMDAFVAAVRTWTFRPFVHAGQPRPVCSMVHMAYPPDKAPAVETLPLPPPPSKTKRDRPVLSLAQRKFTKLMEARRIAGKRAIVPDDETKRQIREFRAERTTGSFRVCLDESGRVESVLPLRSTGFAAYDRDLMAAMSQWIYSPFLVNGKAVAVCTMVTFVYVQR